MRFSDSQLAHFHEQGYLFLPELFAPQEVASLLRDIPALQARETDATPERRPVRRANSTPRIATRRHSGVVRPPRILEGVHRGQSGIRLAQQDQREGGVRRDGLVVAPGLRILVHDGVEPKLASCMVYLDDATHENGCLMVMPGSHRLGRVEHFPDETTTSYKQWTIPIPKLREITRGSPVVSLPGKAGSAVVFHCNLIHGSNHNMAPLPRRSVIFAYNDIDNKPRPVANPRPDYVVSRRFDIVRLEDEDSLLRLSQS
jgi:ectoine hydroxylase